MSEGRPENAKFETIEPCASVALRQGLPTGDRGIKIRENKITKQEDEEGHEKYEDLVDLLSSHEVSLAAFPYLGQKPDPTIRVVPSGILTVLT